MNNKLLMTAITPHPPIMVKEVGGKEIVNVKNSIDGINKLAQKIVSLQPEQIIIITPHSNYRQDSFGMYYADSLNGSMANFGASELKLSFPSDKKFADKLMSMAKHESIEIKPFPEQLPLDHGSFVPLYFLDKAGYNSNVSVINYCGLDIESHLKLGRIINETINIYGKKTIFIASGDLSHRISPNAPAGYRPQGKIFDQKIIEFIKEGQYKEIINIDQTLRHQSGECAYNSLMVAFGLLNGKALNNNIYSYEAPYGVGYLVAEL